MKIQELLSLWEKTANGSLTPEEFTIRLPIEDAAKLQALAEMYPRRALADIITDLLSAALRDLESSLPYERGNTVVGTDEEGDPLYEDVGPTPRYLDLTRKHLSKYKQAIKEPH